MAGFNPAIQSTAAARSDSAARVNSSFAMCGRPPHYNCVIDGDTFYLQNQSVRIADIDAPETHRSRCASEAALGARP